MKDTRPLTHMPQLDALRGLAALLVVLYHYVPFMYQKTVLGNASVRLFFTLSGFLITAILLRCKISVEGGQPAGSVARSFYARRALRIFPLFYLVLSVMLVLNLPGVRESGWWHALYLSNAHAALTGTQPDAVVHLWSLAVEEQFYFVWPWFVLFAPRRTLFRLVLALTFAGPLFRLLLAALDTNPGWLYVPPANFDALGAGALLALMRDPSFGLGDLLRPALRWSKAAGLPLAALSAFLFASGRMLPSVNVVLLGVAAALVSFWLVGRAAEGFEGRFLRYESLTYCGKISYGIYIWHVPVLLLMLLACEGSRFEFLSQTSVGRLVAFALTLTVSALSWRLFERPILSLKDRFGYEATLTPAPDAGSRTLSAPPRASLPC